jgi:cell division protein FtsB
VTTRGRQPARRKPAPRKPASRKPASRNPARPAGRLRRAAGGDRPYLLALFGLVVLVGAMALGPLQNYTAAADRVDSLEHTRDQLRDEVEELEDRRAKLHDHEEIETRARTELGLVKPGEIPFVVVTPDEADQRVGPERSSGEPDGDVPWYRRLGRWLAERVGAQAQ